MKTSNDEGETSSIAGNPTWVFLHVFQSFINECAFELGRFVRESNRIGGEATLEEKDGWLISEPSP